MIYSSQVFSTLSRSKSFEYGKSSSVPLTEVGFVSRCPSNRFSVGGQDPRQCEPVKTAASVLNTNERHTILRRSRSVDKGKTTNVDSWTARFPEPGPVPIPSTDPEAISSLWNRVSMCSSKTTRGGGSAGIKGGPGYLRDTASSTAKSKEKQSSTVSQRTSRPSPYDANFRIRVLNPRGITISFEGVLMTAQAHFETEEVVGSRKEHSTTLNHGTSSMVWLEPEDDSVAKVVREYDYMERNAMCEAEFATYAKETIFRRNARSMNIEYERGFKPERMLELVAKPEDSVTPNWLPPPLMGFDPSTTDTSWNDYAFDLRPDCAYWLSMDAFNPNYASQIRNHVHVINRRITSPYLTIEFKKDEENVWAAENQVAAASSVAIYSRYRLRARALRLSEKVWSVRKSKALRHYCMTLKGVTYCVWLMEAKLTSRWEWAGCEMRVLYRGELVSPASVQDLICWVNEIHLWGLTVHGPKIQDDVKVCINPQESRIRTSAIGPNSEEDEMISD